MSYNRDPQKGGIKTDKGKNRLELVPPEAILAIGQVLTDNCLDNGGKYEDRNWEKGMDWMRVYGAVQRHLQAWAKGEDRDADSGLPHLDHALTGLAFLVAYASRNKGEDTRPTPVRLGLAGQLIKMNIDRDSLAMFDPKSQERLNQQAMREAIEMLDPKSRSCDEILEEHREEGR